MPGLTALVIDDSRQMADDICRMLSFLDIVAKPAYGSRAGIMSLQPARPDLVFLDINMPGVTGFDVLHYIKRDPALAAIPVFIVSSENQPETIQRALAEGAAAFLLKPLDLDTLENTLKAHKMI